MSTWNKMGYSIEIYVTFPDVKHELNTGLSFLREEPSEKFEYDKSAVEWRPGSRCSLQS